MRKTFVINLCKEVSFNEVDLFAYGYVDKGLLSIHTSNTDANSFNQLVREIEHELSLANYHNWQAIFIASPEYSESQIVSSSLTAIVKFVQENFISRFSLKPLVRFIVIEGIYQSGAGFNPIDMQGDYLESGVLNALCDKISNNWGVITAYNRSSIVISDGFQSISDQGFRYLIEKTIEKINADIKAVIIDSFTPSNFTHYGCEIIDSEDLKKIQGDYKLYLEVLKDSPLKYNSANPSEELKKILKKHIGICSECFKAYKFFFFNYSEVYTQNDKLIANLKLMLFIILLLEESKNNNRKISNSSVTINLNTQEISDILSKYYFTLDNTKNDLTKKSNERKVELLLRRVIPPITTTKSEGAEDSEKTSASFSFGQFHSNNLTNRWEQYIEQINETLDKYKKQIDNDIQSIYGNTLGLKDEEYLETIEDIVEFERKMQADINFKTNDISFPEIKDITDDWNDFVAKKKVEANCHFRKLPHKRFTLIVLVVGVFILLLSLFFVHLTLSIQLIWFVIFVLASIGVFFATLQILRRPIILLMHELSERVALVRKEYNNYKDNYINYLNDIQKAKTERQNYLIIKKAIEEKNIFFKKCEYHLNSIDSNIQKSDRLLIALNTEKNEAHVNFDAQSINVDLPCIHNELYNAFSGQYLANNSDAESENIIINGKKHSSVLNGLIESITLTEKF